jgi:tyrosyl-tRNA synthetase
MKINELSIRHQWNDDLGKRMREVINSSFNKNKKLLNILKSIEKEYYDNDDVLSRDSIATKRIENELPKEYMIYLMKYK